MHTNTLENYFRLFKRGMRGVYQHCSEKHLHRYLAEFDFRYNARFTLYLYYYTRSTNTLANVNKKHLITLTYLPLHTALNIHDQYNHCANY